MENVTFVTCQICGKKMKELNSHIPKVHGITVEEYKTQFPDAKIICEESAKKKSESVTKSRKVLFESGYRVSDETRQKMAQKGRDRWEANKDDPEYVARLLTYTARMREAKGDNFKHSEETKAKMRGPRENARGIKRSEETKKKLSEIAKLRDRGPHSEETIQKIKKAWDRRRENAEEFKIYLQSLSVRWKKYNEEFGRPSINTAVPNGFERLYIQFCDDNNIQYEWNYCIDDRHYDFYLPQYDTLIELDGEYWHRFPHAIDNDQLKNSIAQRHNKRLIRLSSDETKNPRDASKLFKASLTWTTEKCIEHSNMLISTRIEKLKAINEQVKDELPSDLFVWD